MRRPVFAMRHFAIRQERCAMKVTMDTCAFGALVFKEWQGSQGRRLLDVGTGTGILSMMAQQVGSTGLEIDALESHEASAQQAGENVKGTKIRVLRGLVQDFAVRKMDEDDKYDTIISNPPFHTKKRRKAGPERHTDYSLSKEDLVRAVDSLLTHDGRFFLLCDAKFKRNRIQLQDAARSVGLYTLRRTFFADNSHKLCRPHICAIEFIRAERHFPIVKDRIDFFQEPPEPGKPGLSHRRTTPRFLELMRGFYTDDTLPSSTQIAAPSAPSSSSEQVAFTHHD